MLACRLMSVLGCLGLTGNAEGADFENLYEVGVRSAVADQPASTSIKSVPSEAAEHLRIYGILAVQPIESAEALVKPVDAQRLMDLVRRGLDMHGFLPVEKGQRPEILITVQYGRGWLPNPYMGNTQTADANSSSIAGIFHGPDPSAVRTILGSTEQLMDEVVPGHEAKLQKATFEKLFVLVEAWPYPTDPKVKPKILWRTTMITDDPDHRDLNVIAARMIAAGAPYFGKEIREGEIDVSNPVAEGHVKVGTPKVVEPKSPLAGR